MPEKQLTIATYAAGAGLAAITLVYVFGPTFFIDGDAASTSASTRKRGIVGLSNPANDCFINSVLQALAGLGDLRTYLIRETHRRKLDGPEVYKQLVADPERKDMPPWKLGGLQDGMVTFGLKQIIDSLNERPIFKKTISAGPFVAVLETAFKQRISRQQQDAQEFLQILAERLCDEYHAGHRARHHARRLQNGADSNESLSGDSVDRKLKRLAVEDGEASAPIPTISVPQPAPQIRNGSDVISVKNFRAEEEQKDIYGKEDGFPFEGSQASQIMCLTCGFKSKAAISTFCSLTLSVPEVASTTLDFCLDQLFKVEHIDEFKCEKCRLIHALDNFQHELSKSTSEAFRRRTAAAIEKLQNAIDTDPEQKLEGVELPDMKFAPKRKIEKSAKIINFPKVLAVHLSRSVFGLGSTTKNSAKVVFPERWRVGGVQSFRWYRLSSVVCHKGSHQSGHYETFRRQTVAQPFSNVNTFQPAPVYSKPPTPVHSRISTPQVEALQRSEESADTSTLSSTPELLSPASAAPSSLSLPYTNGSLLGETVKNGKDRTLSLSTSESASTGATAKGPTSAPQDSETGSIRSMARSARSTLSKVNGKKVSPSSSPIPQTPTNEATMATVRTSVSDIVRGKRRRKNDRWWRISDDKVKEAKTNDVLGMQREVYLLFYELETEDEMTKEWP